MNVMRRLKSIASGRTSISSDPGTTTTGGELSNTKRDTEPTIVNGNGTETGQIISTTVGGRNGKAKQTISYMAERVVGTGSFGVVFQAKCLETGETVAIKKVLQDKRYKNRELQIMRLLDHSNTVQLKHCFFSTTDKDELYLNLVLEYVSETVYRVLKHYSRMNQHMPMIYVQLYTYQICRALNYLHNVIGVCHRDIKPQNLLVNPNTHQLKICDFGSAKKLIFHKKMPHEAVDLVSRLLQYSPNLRCTALEACAHPFFDDLREPNASLPNGRALPPLFNFTDEGLIPIFLQSLMVCLQIYVNASFQNTQESKKFIPDGLIGFMLLGVFLGRVAAHSDSFIDGRAEESSCIVLAMAYLNMDNMNTSVIGQPVQIDNNTFHADMVNLHEYWIEIDIEQP
ncbi:hypothetical protein ACFE04_017575 [Oxalis oulophora]